MNEAVPPLGTLLVMADADAMRARRRYYHVTASSRDDPPEAAVLCLMPQKRFRTVYPSAARS
jgi:hypothetical protein